MMDEYNGIRPNISQVARKAKVSRSTVLKIEEEILTENRIVSPEEKRLNRPIGPGVRTIDSINSSVFVMLMNDDSQRSLADHANILNQTTGTIIIQSTISRFFNHGFDIRGNFMKPNLIPMDKF